VFAGRTDQIAPVAAVRAVLDAVGSDDKTFLVVPGGHMGILAGSTAPERVWKPAAEWLAQRSHVAVGQQRAATRGRSMPVASRRGDTVTRRRGGRIVRQETLDA